MRKRYSGILVVVAVAAQLTGCSLLHISGPCFGVGCPSRTPGEYSQYNPGSNGPKAAAPAPQQAQATKPAAAAAQAPAPTATAVSATPAPTPAPPPTASSAAVPADANANPSANASSGSTSMYAKVQRFFERFTGAGKS
jgi:hypothetical protein